MKDALYSCYPFHILYCKPEVVWTPLFCKQEYKTIVIVILNMNMLTARLGLLLGVTSATVKRSQYKTSRSRMPALKTANV